MTATLPARRWCSAARMGPAAALHRLAWLLGPSLLPPAEALRSPPENVAIFLMTVCDPSPTAQHICARGRALGLGPGLLTTGSVLQPILRQPTPLRCWAVTRCRGSWP